MSTIRQLYQDAILDHSRNPRNASLPARANSRADGDNPLCGDRVTVAVELDGAVIRDIGFRGLGCAISLAAASMMTEAVKGLTTAQVRDLVGHFEALISQSSSPASSPPPDSPLAARLLPLAAFAPVAEYPTRRKCATLCWDTLHEALESAASE